VRGRLSIDDERVQASPRETAPPGGGGQAPKAFII
jgi:hypothetical protein